MELLAAAVLCWALGTFAVSCVLPLLMAACALPPPKVPPLSPPAPAHLLYCADLHPFLLLSAPACLLPPVHKAVVEPIAEEQSGEERRERGAAKGRDMTKLSLRGGGPAVSIIVHAANIE